jgi:preprotein translocase subunit SecG
MWLYAGDRRGHSMRRRMVYFSLGFALLLLGLGLVQQVSSQAESIKVLSYSWYVDNLGIFDVVGEIQNTGSATLNPVVLNGTVYTKDGVIRAFSLPSVVYVNYMTPQQKAPFFMEFPSQGSTSMGGTAGDLSWITDYDHVDFMVYKADSVNGYQYPDLKIQSSSAAVDVNETYWVSGSVKNTGSKTATNVRVIGTFFSSNGTVVAVGYSEILAPTSLNPSDTASFRVGAFDYDDSIVSPDRKISSYSVMVQTEEPILAGTAPSNSSDSSSGSSSSDSSSSSAALAPEMQYIAVIVIVILVVAGVFLVASKRKSGKTPSKKGVKQQTVKKQKPKPKKK